MELAGGVKGILGNGDALMSEVILALALKTSLASLR